MKMVTARDICESYGEGDDEGFEDKEYVIASEANERIKVLEGALNLYISKFGNCGDVYDSAIKALEVKP
jgi:hypothetical protein